MSKWENKPVLIVDGLNTFYRTVATMPDITTGGHAMGGIRGSLYSINFAGKAVGAERCIVVFDGNGGSSYRKKIMSEYKSNRTPTNPLSEDEIAIKQNHAAQLKRLIHYMNRLPVLQMIYNKIEADDVIAYLLNVLAYSEMSEKVVIMSSDKDFLQLVDDKIHVWSPTKKKLYTRDSVFDEYGVIPENLIWYRCFTGDTSDNISGVSGIGKATVKKIPGITTNKISYPDMMEWLKDHPDAKWRNSVDTVKRNHELMQLDVSIISGTTRSSILELLHNYDFSYDFRDLVRMVAEDGTQISTSWIIDFCNRYK